MLFADDIKLYLKFDLSCYDENIGRAQDNINMLARVSGAWGLNMNVAKCVCLRFGRGNRNNLLPNDNNIYHINGAPIAFKNSHKDLGILITNDLKFHSHIKSVANTANQITNNILCCTVCRDAEFLMSIYRSQVIENGCCIYVEYVQPW